uniref:Acetylglutamate kinase n=1 Tax=Batrachospermum sp. TaxID=31373 RepID=A0A8K1YV20_9FLOR|nr:acetylglutamate kinase [Batrachospermum sp.]
MINQLDIIKIFGNFLPFLKELKKGIIVIKYGGAAMKDVNLTHKVIEDIVLLYNLGLKLIIVHGGGPMINIWLNKVSIQTVFQNGLRVTDEKTMEIVEMVLSGKVNKELVNLININKVQAIGLSGKDGGFITASSIDNTSNNLIGKIVSINPSLINLLIDNNYLPVIAPIASDLKGQSYNINADIVAGEIASAINAHKLIILTDTPGILLEASDPTTILSSLDINKVNTLIHQNIITGGMLPKVNCCLKAISQGVDSTHIIDGRVPHGLLLNLLTEYPIGSTIKSSSCLDNNSMLF